MLNSFLSMETVTRGLFIQQLNQDVLASNLAKTYQDSNGYLINSRQRLDVVEGSPLLFGSGAAGMLNVGTGPLVQQITRLRNSFLDSQIQQASTVVGKAEIINSVLSQVNNILNGSAGTLDAAVTTLANAFTALSASPTSVALRSTVVNDGIAFADLARNQYNQIQNLQTNLNGQVNGTVSQINAILQQLASVNNQLLGSSGGNQNDLLDARDYALDRLGRLINIQANFGTAGTVNVFLGNSSISLVDGSGASILQANDMNPHNPGLSNITIQSSQGTLTLPDATNWITGGNLGGELQARDVVLESYKDQVDQIATSVMNITNILHEAGYAADGVTTGTAFFTGTGAQDINVNASLVVDATRKLLATSSTPFIVPAAGDGMVAQFLGDLPKLLANNYIASQPSIGAGIDPTKALNTQPIALAPTPGPSSFTVNGQTINYDPAVDSIDSIITQIHTKVPNVDAVFDATTQAFYMLSNNPIAINNLVGNFTGGLSNWANVKNVLTSSIKMNNGFAPTDPSIVEAYPPLGSPLPGNMDSTVPYYPPSPPFPAGLPPVGPNSQAFRVTPGTGGTFTLVGTFITPLGVPTNQIKISWTNNINNPSDLATILAQIATATTPPLGSPQVTASFNTNTQTLTLYDNTPLPFQIIDNTGNFTVFTGLNANVPIGNLTSGVLTQISTDLSSQQLVLNQSSANLDQLNNSQADLAGVAFNTGDHGVPIQSIQEDAMKSLIAFNASLEVLQIINQMYADLVGIVGGAPPPSPFQQRSS